VVATVTYVRTIKHVAEILDEAPELLQAIASNGDNLTYGISSVYNGEGESITALKATANTTLVDYPDEAAEIRTSKRTMSLTSDANRASSTTAIRPHVRRVSVARPRGKLNSGVALDRPEPSPTFSEGEP